MTENTTLKSESKYPFTGNSVKMSLLKKHLPSAHTYWERKSTSAGVSRNKKKALDVQMAVIDHIRTLHNLTKTELSGLLGKHDGYISGCISRTSPIEPASFNAILDTWPEEAYQALLDYDLTQTQDSKPKELRKHPLKGSVNFGGPYSYKSDEDELPDEITLIFRDNVKVRATLSLVRVEIPPTDITAGLDELIQDHKTMCRIRTDTRYSS